jgi:kinesin family protein 15
MIHRASLVQVDQQEAETRLKELVSGDSDLVDQKKMLTEGLEVMREKVDPNPELTRFAFENISLREQIRRYGQLECRSYLVLL